MPCSLAKFPPRLRFHWWCLPEPVFTMLKMKIEKWKFYNSSTFLHFPINTWHFTIRALLSHLSICMCLYHFSFNHWYFITIVNDFGAQIVSHSSGEKSLKLAVMSLSHAPIILGTLSFFWHNKVFQIHLVHILPSLGISHFLRSSSSFWYIPYFKEYVCENTLLVK